MSLKHTLQEDETEDQPEEIAEVNINYEYITILK